MKPHANAKSNLHIRQLIVQRATVEGRSPSTVAADFDLSRRTVHKWLRRFREEGLQGLEDRSSTPKTSPKRTPAGLARQIEHLRRKARLTAWEIADRLQAAPLPVSRILKRLGLGRLWRVEEEASPSQRYEHDHPGSLIHIDAKKLGKIKGIGHRIHGDRAKRSRGIGWEVAFVAVDDHTRLAYAEVMPAEDAKSAPRFLRRALRWFGRLGIDVERIITDNAKAYSSNAFTDLCREREIRQIFTRPYTPQANGKAERFIQTLSRRWAYGKPYRPSAARARALRPWIRRYNHQRPRRGIGMKTPMARLRQSREQRPQVPHLAPVPQDEIPGEIRDLFGSGRIDNIFSTLADYPKLLERWPAFGTHVLNKSSLGARDRERVILRIGYLSRAGYVQPAMSSRL